ncbi:MAG: 2-oxoacid ferredoxin oxidoreductase, partial [Chloroflexi bacterium]|nr:2-oxoacid ferredoxin oxidoreductase [Chloroflexota bacterium]
YRERVYKLDEVTSYDPADRAAAFEKVQEWGARIPIGVFYETERPVFETQLPALSQGPLVKQKIDTGQAARLLDEFM